MVMIESFLSVDEQGNAPIRQKRVQKTGVPKRCGTLNQVEKHSVEEEAVNALEDALALTVDSYLIGFTSS